MAHVILACTHGAARATSSSNKVLQMLKSNKPMPSGWDQLAEWYDGWMGVTGSHHHRKLALPAVLDLLQLQSGQHILDLGAGQGVLAPFISQHNATYVGVDVSPRLLNLARRRHAAYGRFIHADARHLPRLQYLSPASFDAVVFMLSIEDMEPLNQVIHAASWALREGGRVVILMRHPCFRVPRQSGWGHDEQRKLQYRRVDRYLTPLSVPMKPYPGQSRGVSISFHRPLGHYINELVQQNLLIDSLREITTYQQGQTTAEQDAFAEIPLFLALRARKLPLTP